MQISRLHFEKKGDDATAKDKIADLPEYFGFLSREEMMKDPTSSSGTSGLSGEDPSEHRAKQEEYHLFSISLRMLAARSKTVFSP